MSNTTPTVEQLKKAIVLSEQIEKLKAELAGVLGGSGAVAVSVKAAPVVKAKKGGMSAEGRARIIAAQKLRWAKVKAAKTAAAPAPAKAAPATKKKKRKITISPEGLARIKAAQKARWAKFRKAKG